MGFDKFFSEIADGFSSAFKSLGAIFTGEAIGGLIGSVRSAFSSRGSDASSPSAPVAADRPAAAADGAGYVAPSRPAGTEGSRGFPDVGAAFGRVADNAGRHFVGAIEQKAHIELRGAERRLVGAVMRPLLGR